MHVTGLAQVVAPFGFQQRLYAFIQFMDSLDLPRSLHLSTNHVLHESSGVVFHFPGIHHISLNI